MRFVKKKPTDLFFDTSELFDGEVRLRLLRADPGDPAKDWVPAYIFSICSSLSGIEMGRCDLRLGNNEKLYYGGHIGYRVHPEYPGHHYALKACRLLFKLAKAHEFDHLIITCNPDNWPSRRTCELLCEESGGELLEIVDLPPDNDMYKNGERQKCIFRFRV
ncbi:MAG: GNAT family N-acetyltransferase [Oscillospiraceae bacterium]|nr:GNAT family N-acetyltransferase [Oscillospiraceae bacterium]